MREEHGFLKDDLITWAHKMRIAREEKSNALSKIAERERKKKEKEKLTDEIVQIDVDTEVSLWGLNPWGSYSSLIVMQLVNVWYFVPLMVKVRSVISD